MLFDWLDYLFHILAVILNWLDNLYISYNPPVSILQFLIFMQLIAIIILIFISMKGGKE